MRYTSTDKHEVFCGKAVIGRMYVSPQGVSHLRILQGMPRDEVVTKMLAEVPGFCRLNNITEATYPLLFSAPTKKRKK